MFGWLKPFVFSKQNRCYFLGIYALLLVLSAGFSIKIYHDSRALYGETVALIQQDLPILVSLTSLRANVGAQEPILYEYEFLRGTGCEEIQRYYFSRPLDSAAMETLLGSGIAAFQV